MMIVLYLYHLFKEVISRLEILLYMDLLSCVFTNNNGSYDFVSRQKLKCGFLCLFYYYSIKKWIFALVANIYLFFMQLFIRHISEVKL